MKLFSNSQMEQALSSVNLLINEYPNDSLLFNIRGACYSESGHIDLAITSFERAITLKTDYALGFFGLIMQLGPIANWGLNIDKKTIEGLNPSLSFCFSTIAFTGPIKKKKRIARLYIAELQGSCWKKSI